MIKINLIAQKKQIKMPTVLGVELSEVKIKAIVLVIILGYMVDWYTVDMWKQEITEVQTQVITLNKNLTKLRKEIKKHGNIKLKLEAFNKQVEILKQRSEQVENILKQKTNPKKILERIARNMPEDLWLDNLKIEDNEIKLEGKSVSYKSIGNFIMLANESLFFGESLDLKDSITKEVEYEGATRRVESFKLAGKIVTYD